MLKHKIQTILLGQGGYWKSESDWKCEISRITNEIHKAFGEKDDYTLEEIKTGIANYYSNDLYFC